MISAKHGCQLWHIPRRGLLSDLQLLREAGIINQNLEHEPVELGFGQRIGAFLLDRVLRAQDQERLFQGIINAGHGHLVFLHGLEKSRLGLRAACG